VTVTLRDSRTNTRRALKCDSSVTSANVFGLKRKVYGSVWAVRCGAGARMPGKTPVRWASRSCRGPSIPARRNIEMPCFEWEGSLAAMGRFQRISCLARQCASTNSLLATCGRLCIVVSSPAWSGDRCREAGWNPATCMLNREHAHTSLKKVNLLTKLSLCSRDEHFSFKILRKLGGEISTVRSVLAAVLDQYTLW